MIMSADGLDFFYLKSYFFFFGDVRNIYIGFLLFVVCYNYFFFFNRFVIYFCFLDFIIIVVYFYIIRVFLRISRVVI